MECGVWSVERGVWSVECGVWSVECGERGVWSGDCVEWGLCGEVDPLTQCTNEVMWECGVCGVWSSLEARSIGVKHMECARV